MDARLIVAAPDVDPAGRRAIFDRARRRGFRRFVLEPGDHPHKGPAVELYRRTRAGFAPIPSRRRGTIPLFEPKSTSELDRALTGRRPGGIVAFRWLDDRVIPLENALARRSSDLALWVITARLAEVPAALGALERGADSVIVELRSAAELDRLEAIAGGTGISKLRWHLVTVRNVRPVGVGDRVLVDTTHLLAPEEGMLIGSTAAWLFHVASEAVGSRFSAPRPFRVNAGAAHSYILMADGSTRYLAELVAGDRVLVTRPKGSARAVHVGRVKIERRPLTLVKAQRGRERFTVFVQEAESVRLSRRRSRVAATQIAPGDQVFAVNLPAARHLGTVVDETIEER